MISEALQSTYIQAKKNESYNTSKLRGYERNCPPQV
jgi:hypothetical protein